MLAVNPHPGHNDAGMRANFTRRPSPQRVSSGVPETAGGTGMMQTRRAPDAKERDRKRIGPTWAVCGLVERRSPVESSANSGASRLGPPTIKPHRYLRMSRPTINYFLFAIAIGGALMFLLWLAATTL